jgi:hypothetical protein
MKILEPHVAIHQLEGEQDIGVPKDVIFYPVVW